MCNSATLVQALFAAFCAILCALSGTGGGGMMIGARTGAWAKPGGGGEDVMSFGTLNYGRIVGGISAVKNTFLKNKMTCSFWVKFNDPSVSRWTVDSDILISLNTSLYSPTNGIQIYRANNQYVGDHNVINAALGGILGVDQKEELANIDRWNHVCVVCDSGGISIFVNGVFLRKGYVTIEGNVTCIGFFYDRCINPVSLAKICIRNKSLTNFEVEQDFNSKTSIFDQSSIISLYKDGISDGIVRDSIGNNDVTVNSNVISNTGYLTI